MRVRLSVVTVLFCTLLLACAGRNPAPHPQPQNKEEWAVTIIGAAKGFIEQAQLNHGAECRAGCIYPSVQDKSTCIWICNSINKVIRAQNTAIDVMKLYCANDTWEQGSTCTPNSGLEAKLTLAIRDLDKILTEAKGVVR